MSAPVVIAAGGTGGHLFPAQALADELVRRGREIVLMTDDRGRDYARDFPGARVMPLAADQVTGRGPLGQALGIMRILRGAMRARGALGTLRPAAVVGFGGYPALPGMLAALARGVPALIHEQNAVLGRVNRLLAARVRAVATSFPKVRFLSGPVSANAVLTGNPVRPAVLAAAGARYDPPTDDQPLAILVFGGSQGARVMREVVPAALARLPAALRERIRLTMQARPEDMGEARAALDAAGIAATLEPFFADLPQRIGASHLVIARAGASTCAELTVIGRPSLLVPYPFATDDHQSDNAHALAEAGAALAMAQPAFTPEALSAEIAALAAAPERLQSMATSAAALGRPKAGQALADLVERIAGEGAHR